MPALDEGKQLNPAGQQPEIKKAKIEILDSDGKTAGKDIEVLFNPAEYTLTESSSYSSNSGPSSDAPTVMYAGGKAATLSMELFFDTSAVPAVSGKGGTDATDVSKKIQEFAKLVYIKGELHSPPIVRFIWGSLSFKGVVTELRSTYKKFTKSGMPIQAKVSISIMSYSEQNEEKQKSPPESPDRTKCRTVREDYSIWDMAKSEYRDISKWKVIARANNISNPLEVPPGTIVKIPAL